MQQHALPLRHHSARNSSPIFNYRYDRSRECALHDLTRGGRSDECGEGCRCVTLIPSPVLSGCRRDGRSCNSPKRFCSRVRRGAPTALSTTSLKGLSRSLSATKLSIFSAKDIFVAPTGHEVSFRSSEDTVLFSFRTSWFRKPGLFREARYYQGREHGLNMYSSRRPGDSTGGQ